MVKTKKSISEEAVDLNEDLESLELYLKEINELVPVPICTTSPSGGIIDANRAFQELLGLSMGELAGLGIEAFFSEKVKIGKFLDSLKKGKKRSMADFTFLKKDGVKVPASICGSVRRDREDSLVGFFLVIIDNSEKERFQKELQEKVNEKTAELQAKIREMEKLNSLTIDRELKMIEMKKENKFLKEKLGIK